MHNNQREREERNAYWYLGKASLLLFFALKQQQTASQQEKRELPFLLQSIPSNFISIIFVPNKYSIRLNMIWYLCYKLHKRRYYQILPHGHQSIITPKGSLHILSCIRYCQKRQVQLALNPKCISMYDVVFDVNIVFNFVFDSILHPYRSCIIWNISFFSHLSRSPLHQREPDGTYTIAILWIVHIFNVLLWSWDDVYVHIILFFAEILYCKLLNHKWSNKPKLYIIVVLPWFHENTNMENNRLSWTVPVEFFV